MKKRQRLLSMLVKYIVGHKKQNNDTDADERPKKQRDFLLTHTSPRTPFTKTRLESIITPRWKVHHGPV